MDVTRALTRVADTAVALALDFLLREAAGSGKLLLPDLNVPGKGSGLAAIAMGKHGAGELNYSSDVDLILVYDRAVAPLGPDAEASPTYVRIAKGLVRLLQERTEDGYVLRCGPAPPA